MPYAVVRGARNTIVIPHVGRKIARRRWGVRGWGLGQDPNVNITPGGIVQTGGDDDLSNISATDIQNLTATGPNATPSIILGTPGTLAPAGSFATATSGVTSTGEAVLAPGSIGSPCPDGSGEVISDQYGTCSPVSSLSSALANPASYAALGLTASQAAAITAALTTAQKLISPTGTVVAAPVSSNPFASISATGWILGGVALFAIVLVTSKKR